MVDLELASLNFNYVVINYFISALTSMLVTIFAFWIARRKKIRALYFLGYTMLFFTLSSFLESIAELLLNIPLRNISLVFTVLTGLTLILFVTYIRNESFLSVELVIGASISAIVLFLEFQPANHTIMNIAGLISLHRKMFLNNIIFVFAIYYAVILIFWIILTIIKAPRNLKKYSILLILPFVIGGIVFYIFNQIVFIYQPFSWLILTLNFSFLIILVLCPQLLFILPYEAHRLNVFEMKTGISLFQYEWSSEGIDEDLLSGLISAIRSMGEEVLKKGGLKQIDWELGLLFFSKREHIIVTLLSSKASKSLRSNLSAFTSAFESKFRDLLTTELKDLNQFSPAMELIDHYFGNIPKH